MMIEATDVLFPELPIIDAHHHLIDHAAPFFAMLAGRSRYLLEDHAGELAGGHNFVATVAVESHGFYRCEGPADYRSVGETECLNGQAALADTGVYGPCRIAAAIVAAADLRLGDAVGPVLEAHIAAAPKRFRGIRQAAVWDADPAVAGPLGGNGAHMYASDVFRRGFAILASLGLSFDAFIFSPQIPDVTDLARAFPYVPIILNHVGNPLGIGNYAGRRDEVFAQWRADMAALAEQPNALVKLGGLGTFLSSFPSCTGVMVPSVEALVTDWAPYLETAIALFGAQRCMFEGNYPIEHKAGDYRTIWSAFKQIAAGCSASERADLFAGTAARSYRISAKPYCPDSSAGL